MTDWVAIGGFGGACAGLGTIATLWITHKREGSRETRAEIEAATELRLTMARVPIIESTLNTHLIECANMNGAMRSTLQSVESAIRELTRRLDHIRVDEEDED